MSDAVIVQPKAPAPKTAGVTVANIKVKAPPAELVREPMVNNLRSPGWISDAIAGVAEGKTPLWWWCALVPSVVLMITCFTMVIYLLSVGVGVWGPGHPVMW